VIVFVRGVTNTHDVFTRATMDAQDGRGDNAAIVAGVVQAAMEL
jgi:hypothetical protein